MSHVENYEQEILDHIGRALLTFGAGSVCRILGLKRYTLTKLMRSKKLWGYYQGGKIRVPSWAIWKYQKELHDQYDQEFEKMEARVNDLHSPERSIQALMAHRRKEADKNK